MNERRWGLWLAFASLAVNAPRLMLVYLKADGLTIGTVVEAILIGSSGVANGIVLAGSGIVIAHTLAKTNGASVHKAVRPLMLFVWVLSLAFATVLITPAFVSGIRGVALSDVLANERAQWAWSAVAVIAVEVAAAGSMLADAALNGRSRSQSKPQATVSEPAREQKVVALTTKCTQCGKEIRNTTNAKNAHQRFCRPAERSQRDGNAGVSTASGL